MNEIKIIEGFGDKHWAIAVYIDDQLFGEKDYSSESFQEDSLTMQLIEKMAAEYNITINRLVTNACFRLSSYYTDVPQTFQEYEKTIFEFYENHQTFESIEDYVRIWTPSNENDENFMLSIIHDISGGINFDEFYKTYLKEVGSIFESEEWKNYTILSNHPSKRGTDEARESYNSIYESMKKRLEWVWNAPKEIEPYKQTWLALKNKA